MADAIEQIDQLIKSASDELSGAKTTTELENWPR